MSGLIWPENLPPVRRRRANPMPTVPKTGWQMRTDFPDLSAANALSFDLETFDPQIDDHGPGWARGQGHIIGVALGTDDGFNFYLPIRHEGFQNLDPQKVLSYARTQLGRPEQPKIGHNILYDVGWLEHEGVTVRGELHDTWIAEKLLNFDREASLEAVAQRYLGTGKASNVLYDWAWKYWGKSGKASEQDMRKCAMKNLWRCPPELVGFYAESDVALPMELGPIQFAKLEKKGLWDVYQMECKLLRLLVHIRMAGVSVDLDAAERAKVQIADSAALIQKQIDDLAGRPVNTGSPKDMEKLFTQLKIKFNRTDSGQMQLTGEYMDSISHPIGAMVTELAELKKFNSTFIQNAILGSHVNGKIHCEFNQIRAITGRMSSSNPNLQQIPSRSELAKVVRAIFIPDEGHDFWSKWDYSSIESRILAHYAIGEGASELRQEYRDNPDTDYHTFTQDMIKRLVGLELPRKHVKNVNFAGIYGASENKLQRMMKLSDEEAETFFTAYHTGLPYVRGTMKAISDVVEKRGYSKTILGRRALFDKWEPKYTPKKDDGEPWTRPIAYSYNKALAAYGPNIKRAYLHKALNYTIQGSAADLMKAALVKCYEDGVFDEIGVPRLIVHDEVDLSVPFGANTDALLEMKNIMETVVKFKIPIRVAGEWGPNWSEQYPFE